MKKRIVNMSIAALAGVLVIAGGLAGCSSPEEQARAEELMSNPEIKVVGTFDGCEVKFVNRYHRDMSFYLARCGTTIASTQQYEETQGKSRVARTRLTITQELAELDKQRETLKAEQAAAEKREAAIAKLSPEERTALGLSEDTKK
jgi:hypothetical protein